MRKNIVAKRLAQLLQGLRGQFLDEKLDQKVLHHAFSLFANTSSAHDCGAMGNPRRARLSK